MLARPILLAAKILVSGCLVAWLALSGQFHLPNLDLSTAAPALVIVVVATLATLSLQGARWWFLIRMHGINIGFWPTARMFWISQFYAVFLPGAVGGDIVRGYYIFRHAPQARVAGATSILLDRGVGLLAFVMLAVAAFAASSLGGDLPPLLIRMGWFASLLLLAAVVWLALAYSFGPRVARHAPKRWRTQASDLIEMLRAQKAGLAGILCLSLISAAFMLAAFMAAAAAIGVLAGGHILMVTPAVVVANNLPISLGGLGVGEATAAMLFGQIGIAEGAAIMILVRAGLLLWRFTGAALLILPRRQDVAVGYAAE
ncbi:MAG: lysylphosphatidylglycerol synthase transmembrane domain-containing protein [Alphaproteobacteria bacterium]